jgi:tetratricopeptide (TPR) repeat protein
MPEPWHHDGLGNALSTRRPDTAAAIRDFVLGFLGYDRRIVNILACANDDANDALANAYAGLLFMLSETGGIPDQARHYLARAENAEPDALPRERGAIAALRAWINDDVPTAQRIAEDILRDHPRDLVMLKLHQYHDFVAGDFAAMLRAALGSREAANDVAYLHGMLAFAYEQMHLLEKAEHAARHALALADGREPWAQHALAHVMLTQGRIDEGAAFLESMRPTWTGLTSFMYTHAWWHLALFYLSQGRMAEALAAYDDHCWAQQKDFSQDQVGAVSLLARFEFAGIDVGRRWRDLGPYLAARRRDIAQPFLSLQYLYGLAKAGRPEAETLLDAIRSAASEGPRASRRVWQEVGAPLAEGLMAHAAGDATAALAAIEPQQGRLPEIGGSHAQRDLFDQILLDCLLRAGHWLRAQQILETRRLTDPAGVPLNEALVTVYTRLGLPALAAEARSRLRQRPKAEPVGG